MFKFIVGTSFHAALKFFIFFLQIWTKVLQHPCGNELTASTIILHRNSIYIGMTTTIISSRLTMHLSSGVPRQHTLVDYQQQLTRSSQQYKNIISWLTIINHVSLKPSLLIQNIQPPVTLVWAERSHFFLSFPPNPAPPISIIIHLFPHAVLIPLTAFNIPHLFPFMLCTKINNYSLHYHYTNCT